MPSKKPPPPSLGDPLDDSLVPYYSTAIRERLALHALTQSFIEQLFVATGGSLKEAEGGDWDRVRRANAFLRQHEEKAPKKEKDRLVAKIQRLPHDRRQLLRNHARVAGLGLEFESPALTTGEVAYYSRACDWIEIADIDDVVECISTAFPGTAEVSSSASVTSGTETEGEGGAAPSPSEPAPRGKRKLVLDGGVIVPDGYTDAAIDLGGTTAEVRARINEILHATFIAELNGKNRAGITEWLMKTKLKGFRIPEDWRVEDEIEEAA